jgi:hypothetical protein
VSPYASRSAVGSLGKWRSMLCKPLAKHSRASALVSKPLRFDTRCNFCRMPAVIRNWNNFASNFRSLLITVVTIESSKKTKADKGHGKKFSTVRSTGFEKLKTARSDILESSFCNDNEILQIPPSAQSSFEKVRRKYFRVVG